MALMQVQPDLSRHPNHSSIQYLGMPSPFRGATLPCTGLHYSLQARFSALCAGADTAVSVDRCILCGTSVPASQKNGFGQLTGILVSLELVAHFQIDLTPLGYLVERAPWMETSIVIICV